MKFPTAPRLPGQLRSSLSVLPLVLVGLLSVLLFGGLVGLGAGLFALMLIAPVLIFGALLFTGSFSSFRFGGEGVFWL
eukprot:gene17783-22682_t